MGLVELRIGKRTKSLVLEADGKHLLTDVYTSGVVLVGLAVVYLTGWFRFDGIIACIAGESTSCSWAPSSFVRPLES
jgi:divalent metal cation (Fe/Co/Zn/Cd) transporter